MNQTIKTIYHFLEKNRYCDPIYAIHLSETG